tara:strand:+ start:195 stop:374 length:180 start_codon:yes stop_codon:yes gene_type:complete
MNDELKPTLKLENLLLPIVLSLVWWALAFNYGFITTILYSIIGMGFIGILLTILDVKSD